MNIFLRGVFLLNKAKPANRNNAMQSWILWGIPVVLVVGSLMHFAYDWSGNATAVAIFAPVNESVWEHLKMAFWPMLVWWIAGYFLLRNNNKISASKWFCSSLVAIISCLSVIVSFYYTYTGALGIESLLLDIFSFVLGIAMGQLLSLHIYKHCKPNPWCLFVAFAVIILLAAAFIVFTFAPRTSRCFKIP